MLQRAHDDFVEAHVNLHFARGWLKLVGRKFAGQQFIKHHAERIDVGPAIDALIGCSLLGGHVFRRSDDLILRWALPPHPNPLPLGGGEGVRSGAGVVQNLGNAEVGDFDPARFVEEQILGLDVAVNDAVLMGELEGFANRRHDGEGLLRCEPARRHGLAQVDTIDKFHEQEEKAGGFPGSGFWGLGYWGRRETEIVDGDDVWMVQAGEGPGFAGKAIGERGILFAARGEEFQGDHPVQRFLPCFEDDAHAALTDQFDDLELRKRGGDGFNRRRGGPVS